MSEHAKEPRLEDFEFGMTGLSLWGRIEQWAITMVHKLAGRPKPRLIWHRETKARVSLPDLAKALDLWHPELSEVLDYHNTRLRRQHQWTDLATSIAASLLFVAVGALVFSKGITDFTELAARQKTLTLVVVTLPFAVSLFVIIIAIKAILFRILGLFVEREFADTLCVATSLELLVALASDDVLVLSHKKKELLSRIQYLARVTRLLPSRFDSKSETTRAWTLLHFRKSEMFIRERERWAIAPVETTLKDLRRDFAALAQTLILGRYGQISWEPPKDQVEVTPQTLLGRILQACIKSVAILFPMVLLAVIVFKPEQLPLPIDRSIAISILIAWLVLSLETVFKLGVIDRLTSIIRDIRSLK